MKALFTAALTLISASTFSAFAFAAENPDKDCTEVATASSKGDTSETGAVKANDPKATPAKLETGDGQKKP